jgi:peptidoglycan/xylan/chitin deacetylase (PgdA/CDA1 family)
VVLGAILAAAALLPLPAQLPTVPRLIQQANPVYCGGTRGHNVALTFDDGPSQYTLRLTRALRRLHARATFFDVGSRIAYWPAAVRAQARVGELGNHTWSHPHLAGLSPVDVRRELDWTQWTIGRTVDAVPRFFRPPYEQATSDIDLLARSFGLLDIRWSADSGDSRPGRTPAAVVRAATAGLRPGAIILFHDPHPSTPAVAAAVVRAARREGLRPVTVSELLARQPPSSRQITSSGAARCVP